MVTFDEIFNCCRCCMNINIYIARAIEDKQNKNTVFGETKSRFWLNNFSRPICFDNVKKDRL